VKWNQIHSTCLDTVFHNQRKVTLGHRYHVSAGSTADSKDFCNDIETYICLPSTSYTLFLTWFTCCKLDILLLGIRVISTTNVTWATVLQLPLQTQQLKKQQTVRGGQVKIVVLPQNRRNKLSSDNKCVYKRPAQHCNQIQNDKNTAHTGSTVLPTCHVCPHINTLSLQ